jgi:hypothetical protein
MDPLARLDATLRAAASILDNAAGQIRDAALSPTREHIGSIGQALAHIFEIQNAIYQLRPELEPQYTEEPEEVRAANRRLGEALIAAYDLADGGNVQQAVANLQSFAATEPSTLHRELAAREQDRLASNYGA